MHDQTADTRLARRTALDLSIDEEIVRGDRRGMVLTPAERTLLAIMVDRELAFAEPFSEEELLRGARPRRLFSLGRQRRCLALLESCGLVRRERGCLHATVAGAAAIRRPSQLEAPRLPRPVLRVMRQAELSRLGA